MCVHAGARRRLAIQPGPPALGSGAAGLIRTVTGVTARAAREEYDPVNLAG
jgi:hypothetical protein